MIRNNHLWHTFLSNKSSVDSSVGILDGDIFGPSVPLMMNIKETPLIDEHNMIIPPINFGIKCLSMGLLVEDSSAVVWRGPLVMSALQRLLKGANWVWNYWWKCSSFLQSERFRDHWTFLLSTHRLEQATFIFRYPKMFLFPEWFLWALRRPVHWMWQGEELKW